MRLNRDEALAAIKARHDAMVRREMERRAALTFELGDHFRRLLEIGFRLHHPEWSEQQVQDAVVEHLLGPELAQEVREWKQRKATLA